MASPFFVRDLYIDIISRAKLNDLVTITFKIVSCFLNISLNIDFKNSTDSLLKRWSNACGDIVIFSLASNLDLKRM